MRVTLGNWWNGETVDGDLMSIGMEKPVPEFELISSSESKLAIFSRMVRSTSGGFDVKRERTELAAAE